MGRRLLTSKEMNILYKCWSTSGSVLDYNNLLQGVIDSAFSRFAKTDGADRAEDISAMMGAKIYRALPGYSGPSPLKPYEPSRGTFHAFQSTMARTTRLDYLKRPTASGVGDNEVSYCDNLDWISHKAEDPWSTNGRKRIVGKPSENYYLNKKDPKLHIPFGKSAWKIK